MSSYCKFLLRFISDNELFMAMLFKEGYIYMCVCAYIYKLDAITSLLKYLSNGSLILLR